MSARRILFCLILLLVLPLCTGCVTESPAADTTAATAASGIRLAADGQCLFSVIRPEDATEEELDTIVYLRKTAKSFFGSTPAADTDWAIPKGRHTPAAFEILIGRTEAEESKAVYAGLPYGSYTVRVVGDKLVIAGWCDEVYPLLRNEIYRLLDTCTENGVCTIPADCNITRNHHSLLDSVPLYDGYVDRVVDLDDGSYMLYIEKADADGMDTYCAALREAGYTLYTEHTAAGNRFATYKGEENNLHVYYTETYRTLRIVIDPAGSPLPARAEDVPAFKEITSPKVSMIGLNYTGTSDAAIGLCMAFLLPSGEFIVVDGGFTVPTESDYVYNRLRELAPDPENIVIAAWYLTHAHIDHTQAFNDFVARHSRDVPIRQVVFNFTHDAFYDPLDGGTTEANVRVILGLLPNTEVIKAHTGQLFHYPGASVEMLFTFDDYLPRELPYVNATSLIFRVTLGGQTVMVLGDASEHITPMACRMYGDYLKSDIVQMSHHGLDGATAEMYSLIAPHTALWPAGETVYAANLDRACNKTLLKMVRDVYVSRFDVITLPLPHTPIGNNERYSAP